MRSKPIPVACTLDDNAATGQLSEWVALQRLATERRTIPGGGRLLVPLTAEEAVRDLARREQACCAFLNIDVSVIAGEVVLEVTSADPDAAPVIALLIGLEPPG